MSLLRGNIIAPNGRIHSLAEVAKIQPRQAPDDVFELLQARLAPTFANMGKKDRKHREKKLKKLRREVAALKAAAAESKKGQVGERNADRNFETGKTLTEFTIFEKLAPELRQMIWKEALPGAQAVKITADGYNYQERPTLMITTHRFCYRGKASYIPSPLLFVNSESRAIVNADYPLVFAAQLGGRPIRFNFKKDTLYFECPSAMVNFYGGTLPMFNPELQTFGFIHDMDDVHNKVQHVAVGNTQFYKNVVGGTLNLFKALKTVILGDLRDHDESEAPDTLIKFMLGEEKLRWGWELAQTFKSVEDGNMPKIRRLRKDEFDDHIEKEYKQLIPAPPVTSRVPTAITFAPAMQSMPIRQPKILEHAATAGLVVRLTAKCNRVE